MTHITEIREFITNNFLFGDGSSLHDDKSFLDNAIIDSTGMLELIMFLETNCGIKILPEEMVPDNLDSVNRVAAFVARKLNTTATPNEANKKQDEFAS